MNRHTIKYSPDEALVYRNRKRNDHNNNYNNNRNYTNNKFGKAGKKDVPEWYLNSKEEVENIGYI